MNTSVNKTLSLARRHRFLLAFMAALVGLIAKAPEAITQAQFWAEDGVQFFASQFGQAWPQFFIPYAGYLHTIPRFVAWVASLFPYAQAPLIYNASATLIDAWAIAYFATRMRFIIPCWACVAIILAAPGNGEILGTLTNVQWFLQLALFAAIISPAPKTRNSSIAARVVALTLFLSMSLTGPFSILILILLIGMALIYYPSLPFKLATSELIKKWWIHANLPVILAVATGGVIQLCVLLTIGQRTSGHFSLDIARKFFSEGIEWHTLGSTPLPPNVFLMLLVFLTAYIAYQIFYKKQEKWLLILLGLIFASLQILPLCYAGSQNIVDTNILSGDRYFFFMKISLYLTSIALLIEHRLSKRIKLYPAIPLALLALIVTHPALGKRFALADLNWEKSAAVLEEGKFPVELPINPEPLKIILQAPENTDKH